MKKIAITILTVVLIMAANAEVTKVQDLNGCDLYFSTQLWTCVSIPDSKEDTFFLSEMLLSMSRTDTPCYEENYKGYPRLEETKELKAEDLKEDVLKLLDISGSFYLTDSYWGGKLKGGSTEMLFWKEGERIYLHRVVINKHRGISYRKDNTID